VSRDDITTGASGLGVEMDEHVLFVLEAMRGVAGELGLEGQGSPPAG
jgi:predicted hydrolase (HD superfamily)